LTRYFYTGAALPTLRLGDKVPITEEKFLEFAEDTLKPADFRVLCKSRLGSLEPTGFGFADRILSFEKELRLELARARLAKLKFEAPLSLPESDGRDVLLEKVRAVLALDSPLEAELFLNQLRWSFLEDMGAGHFYDLEALVVYYLKLQIALRQETMQKEPGRRAFEETYENVSAGVRQIIRL
jgi:hypothetical protein